MYWLSGDYGLPVCAAVVLLWTWMVRLIYSWLESEWTRFFFIAAIMVSLSVAFASVEETTSSLVNQTDFNSIKGTMLNILEHCRPTIVYYVRLLGTSTTLVVNLFSLPLLALNLSKLSQQRTGYTMI
eukprot:TRINITY_DN14298_c0_g1_i1.p1 TRINITY_DN14298_c0_g1~~TRINITY_DN14298_c0_g1_i1.p1  ORF type:complete len:143 (+),score=11.62 TRINITY_DN14298_c0_g1_i1:49-429(+)